jgi:hypothetical protein
VAGWSDVPATSSSDPTEAALDPTVALAAEIVSNTASVSGTTCVVRSTAAPDAASTTVSAVAPPASTALLAVSGAVSVVVSTVSVALPAASDAAPVASDVFIRMAHRGQIKESDFRVIYRSQKFPTSSFAYAHDLDPKLVDKMLGCFYDYRFPPEMQKAFEGADRFFPINYKTTWEVVRTVARASGESFDKQAYDALAKSEAEAAKKK